MGNVRILPSGNYQARIKVNDLKLAKTFSNLKDAQKWINENGKINNLASLSDKYLLNVMTVKGVQRGGYETIKFKLNTLSRFFQEDLRNITKLRVVEYRDKRLMEVSTTTVRLEIQLLSRFLRWAKELTLVDFDVTADVRKPKASKPRDRVLTKVEFEKILKFLSPQMQSIAIVAYETAMRRNEILSITPKMVFFDKKIVHLSGGVTKNGESRSVPLSTNAESILKGLCDKCTPTSCLFGVKPKSVSKAFERACNKAGVIGACFHSLRHTCITRYAEKGLSALQLQCISGHKSITMLAKYTHIKAENVVNLMD